MFTKSKAVITLIITTSILSLVGCQTTPQQAITAVNVTNVDNIDSDNDGVLDSQDKCPNTQANMVVDDKGCYVQVYHLDGLMIVFRPQFKLGSKQLLPLYDLVLIKMAEVLKSYDKEHDSYSPIYIFGHVTDKEVSTLNKLDPNALAKNRAATFKNMLVTEYDIEPERIITYNCANQYPSLALKDSNDSKNKNFDNSQNQNAWGVTVAATNMGIDALNNELPNYFKQCLQF